MTDDNSTFIREVNEELRSDALKAFWRKYRFVIIGIAVAIVIGTAVFRGWEYWREVTAARSGDAFLAALELAREGKSDEALAAFAALEKDGHGEYPMLAKLRAATVLAAKGDGKAAADAFLAIANGSGDAAIRDVARIRAGYLLVDAGSYDEVSAAVERLAVDGNVSRHSAREALGLSAYKQGDLARARQWFEAIAADQETPGGVAGRANLMLDLIAARGGAS
jgi:Uncharacterized protein conserved in bacteria